MLLAALRVELAKLVRQRFALVSLGVLAVLVGLFVWGTWQAPLSADLPGTAGGEFIVAGKIKTGPLLSYMLLRIPVALNLLIPLLIATVTGGLLAGERHLGTLRTLMVRPLSRSQLLAAKLLAAGLYATGLTAFLGLFSLLLGYLVFGGGDLLPLGDTLQLVILPENTALARLALAYGLSAVAMISIASLGMFFSSLCDNPLTAAGLTVAFLLVCGTLQVLPWFHSWQPHLLTSHLSVGGKVFAGQIPWGEVGRSLGYLVGYSLLAGLLAGVIFRRRDILC